MQPELDVFFSSRPGAFVGVIDFVIPKTGRGAYSGSSLDDIRQKYPDAEILSQAEADRRIEAHYRTPPAPISRDAYEIARDALPPMQWTHRHGAESFKFMERVSGNMTRIYVRAGNQCWSLVDRFDLDHDAILALVRMVAAPVRRLVCCCCGSETRGRQWHNRDTGFGCCPACVPRMSRNETPEQLQSLIGIKGIHYEVKE